MSFTSLIWSRKCVHSSGFQTCGMGFVTCVYKVASPQPLPPPNTKPGKWTPRDSEKRMEILSWAPGELRGLWYSVIITWVFFVAVTLEFIIYLSYEETEELNVQKKVGFQWWTDGVWNNCGSTRTRADFQQVVRNLGLGLRNKVKVTLVKAWESSV